MAGPTGKLEALILYVAERMQQDAHAGRGRVKLAKLLFHIDFEAYARWGQPVTEASYHADELGPVPVEELTAARDLEAAGLLEWRTEWDRERLPVARGRADLDLFADHERDLIDEVLQKYQTVTARQMVDEAHHFPGWLIAWNEGAGEGARIPYETIFWNPKRSRVEPWEDEHARTLAARISRNDADDDARF